MSEPYCITVDEFLEFEFKFELADHIGCHIDSLIDYKPTKRAIDYVLAHVVSKQCFSHMRYLCASKRLKNG